MFRTIVAGKDTQTRSSSRRRDNASRHRTCSKAVSACPIFACFACWISSPPLLRTIDARKFPVHPLHRENCQGHRGSADPWRSPQQMSTRPLDYRMDQRSTLKGDRSRNLVRENLQFSSERNKI